MLGKEERERKGEKAVVGINSGWVKKIIFLLVAIVKK